MTRFAVGVEYIGTGFSGWQALAGRRTVQREVEAALSAVADHPVSVVTAGRTDAGVHAQQQIVHFDSDAQRSAYAWLLGSNTRMPQEVSLRWIQPVDARFHARYSALRRSYRYVIHNHSARSPLAYQRSGWWPQTLDVSAMHTAAQILVGEHDFSAFRDSQCQSRTTVRRMYAINVQRRHDFIVIDVCGNAFLHHMVRNIVGTLAQVGLGKQPVQWVAQVLAGGDRRQAGMTAPAAGLYFVGPEYPAEFALPPLPRPWFPA